ncbi:transmembrane and coiled-coil domain-containing protein 6 [Chanos chanos]|uniref:Transmembrane and coiled-coil domain-containing protein 6 n=1 Tax=Chanos chanos TaxID=29144 RepID=A0A6J2URJ1_CHACN|nr:transmembrane and coiled-coil domain-containing protein 6 [Chanos chanos]
MWRLKAVGHKARRSDSSLEEFKLKRREHEKVLRQARRDKQLVSKRLLLHEDEVEGQMDISSVPVSHDQVLEMVRKVQSGGVEKVAHLRVLRRALRNPEVQLTFVKLENSIYVLVGLLSGSDAQCRLEAAQCFHELSHSSDVTVGSACLPATPYLLTYLSGQSAKLTALCLYTLGNLCAESKAVREKLLAQGVVAALANCTENQRSNLAVMEAVGFTLSQLIQAKDAAEKIIPVVLGSGVIPRLLSMLTPDPQFGLGPAIECAWCLHYLSSSDVDTGVLVNQGTLSHCSSILIALGGTLARGSTEEGIELLLWPLLRCLGNLLVSLEGENPELYVEDSRILAALCVFTQTYLQPHPALARESLWVLNNLTAGSSVFCSALLFCNLVPVLIQLLPFSQGINTMVLRVLGNVAHYGMEYCVQLTRAGVLAALCATLKMADPEVVILSLEVLHMLLASSPQVGEEFTRQNGVPLLEAIQYDSDGEKRLRASYILDNHLSAHSSAS